MVRGITRHTAFSRVASSYTRRNASAPRWADTWMSVGVGVSPQVLGVWGDFPVYSVFRRFAFSRNKSTHSQGNTSALWRADTCSLGGGGGAVWAGRFGVERVTGSADTPNPL